MHTLIVGASFSGKSNLAKSIAKGLADSGQNIVVFDPLKSSGWPKGAKLYSKPEVFISEIWAHKNCHVFVDESRVLFEAERNEAERLAYLGRHGGRLVYFIGQRASSMIPPNARNQCGKVFAFKQSLKDSQMLAEEYSEIFLKCPRLQKGEFLAGDGFAEFNGSLDYTGGLPPKINIKKVNENE